MKLFHFSLIKLYHEGPPIVIRDLRTNLHLVFLLLVVEDSYHNKLKAHRDVSHIMYACSHALMPGLTPEIILDPSNCSNAIGKLLNKTIELACLYFWIFLCPFIKLFNILSLRHYDQALIFFAHVSLVTLTEHELGIFNNSDPFLVVCFLSHTVDLSVGVTDKSNQDVYHDNVNHDSHGKEENHRGGW